MSRWKYKTDRVTVGDNTQNVRALTAGERSQFAMASREIKEGKRLITDLPAMVARFGCIDPPLESQEIDAMPSDLLDAVVSKIMDLSGMKTEKKAPDLEITTVESPQVETLPKPQNS